MKNPRQNQDYKARYGAWAGFPEGHKPDFERCCEEVSNGTRGALYHQCFRKRGYGPGGAYCKQHDPATVQAKRDAWEAKYRKQQAIDDRRYAIQSAGERMLAALHKIANGDNDPRSTAREALRGLPSSSDTAAT
jgi:hypothetical protein